jgi:hypothetical protein
MKHKFLVSCSIVVLAFTSACSLLAAEFRAANSPPVTGRAFTTSFKYLGRSPDIGLRKGEEGIACDGDNYYLIYRWSILKVDSTWTNILAENKRPFSGLKGYDHLGAGEYHDGKLYVATESYHGCGYVTNQSIFVYNADTLKRVSTTCVSNDTTEVSAVTIETNQDPSGVVFVSNFCDGSSLYKLNLPDLSLINTLPLDQDIQKLQGLAWHNGLIYAVADAQTSGVVYDIDPHSGHVKKLAFLTFPRGKEVEGCLFKGDELQIMVAGGRANNYVYYFSP